MEFGARFLDLCLFIQLGHGRHGSTQKQLHNALIWDLKQEEIQADRYLKRNVAIVTAINIVFTCVTGKRQSLPAKNFVCGQEFKR